MYVVSWLSSFFLLVKNEYCICYKYSGKVNGSAKRFDEAKCVFFIKDETLLI